MTSTSRAAGGALTCLLLAFAVACGSDEPPARQAAPTVPPVTTAPPTVSPTPSPLPPTFAQTYASVNGGVVRIDSEECGGQGSGTGFLIAPDLVATVAHVVADAATVRVTQETHSVSASVLGMNAAQDVALLRISSPVQGHVFTVDPAGPEIGEPVGVIGFPAGDSGLVDAAGAKSLKLGTVNGLDRKADIAGITRTGLVELDALTRPGNSGSPVMTVDGRVVGLISAGPGDADAARARFAVDSSRVKPLLDAWAKVLKPVTPSDCSTFLDPDGNPTGLRDRPGGEVTEVVATMNLYFTSINQGDYTTAYAQFHPSVQNTKARTAFAAGVDTSKDGHFSYRTIAGLGRDLIMWVTFTSTQDAAHGPAGMTCADWSLDYTFSQSEGLWLITKSSPHAGAATAYSPCAPGEPEADTGD